MRRTFAIASWIALVALVAACGKDDAPGNPAPAGSGGTSSTAGGGGSPAGSGGAATSSSTGGTDTGGTAGTGGSGGSGPPDAGLVPCLDRPADLPRPPSGQLPCDLIPPSFAH